MQEGLKILLKRPWQRSSSGQAHIQALLPSPVTSAQCGNKTTGGRTSKKHRITKLGREDYFYIKPEAFFRLSREMNWTFSAQSCLTLCNSMDCSIPCFPVLHDVEFFQYHVHWINDAFQLSHPLSSPSLLSSIFPSIRVFSSELLFASGGQCIGASASVLPVNTQSWFHLEWTSLTS